MRDLTTGTTKKQKREYATHRTTKSVRESKTPGVQVLSLQDDMTEIKQAEYQQHASLRRRQNKREMCSLMAIEENILASFPESAERAGAPVFDDTFRIWHTPRLIHAVQVSLDDEALNILIREIRITEAYESCEYENIAEKHRDFLALCGGLLRLAQQRHNLGDSSLLDLLLKHNVPERWWKTGWQKFLDHIWTTGKMQDMDSHLQAAYIDVFSLRGEVPALREHWEECLKVLGHYSMKLHELYPGPSSPGKSKEDDGGEGNHSVDFSKRWHKPLSPVCRMVLVGWSIIGRTVKPAVYMKLGWVFCRVDKLWS